LHKSRTLSTSVHKFGYVLIGMELRLFTPFRVTYVVILRRSRRIYSLQLMWPYLWKCTLSVPNWWFQEHLYW